MKIVVSSTDEQWKELIESRQGIDWQRVNDATDFFQYKNADAFFYLNFDGILPEFSLTEKPFFINAVKQTLADLKVPVNVLRINGWPTFLDRSAWEVAGIVNENIKIIFKELHIKIHTVEDEPGFIAARIIAMIINEAYFAVNDKVSSKKEIDTAMKLGTNYPYGPFEWVELIGKKNILELLLRLNITDSRYEPAALLIYEVNDKD